MIPSSSNRRHRDPRIERVATTRLQIDLSWQESYGYRHERCQMPADHVLADTAERVPQRSHATGEFRPVQTTMEIFGALESADRARRHRAHGSRIARGAIRIARR